MAKVKIIRTDGTEENLEFRGTSRELTEQIHRAIGAETCDVVNLRDGRVMLVDDNGYETEQVETSPGHFVLKPVRALKPVNLKATGLYHSICRPGTTHMIVGDVAIAVDADF